MQCCRGLVSAILRATLSTGELTYGSISALRKVLASNVSPCVGDLILFYIAQVKRCIHVIFRSNGTSTMP